MARLRRSKYLSREEKPEKEPEIIIEPETITEPELEKLEELKNNFFHKTFMDFKKGVSDV